MHFEELTGAELKFYGVDCNTFCLGLGNKKMVFEAVEDESDGYRSMLEDVRSVSGEGHIFFDMPLARVIVMDWDTGGEGGYQLIDSDTGHVWLSMGTNYNDEYYPYFIFQYTPSEMI
jgi:hypothetical protein